MVLSLPERSLRATAKFIPAIPAVTGFLLILSLGLFLDLGDINLYVSSLTQERHSFLFLAGVLFILGLFTSLGPSTLPFLPVVFGMLVTRHTRINIWGAGVDIEVIAYDEGIFFLDRFYSGEFKERISNLMLYGVKFRACSVAMKMFGVDRESLFDGVEVVRSGFEYHVLKVKEGYIPIYL